MPAPAHAPAPAAPNRRPRSNRGARGSKDAASPTTGWRESTTAATSAQLQLELIRAERDFLHELLRKGELTDESRRLIERELDLEEASIFCNREANAPPL